MKDNRNKKHVVAGSILVISIVLALVFFNRQNNHIKKVILTSPNNLAFQNQLEIDLERPGNVFVQYWVKGSGEKFRTVKTNPADL
jgi:hypothetical protein